MAEYGDDCYKLEEAISQCRQIFENVLRVQTTALLKKSTLEQIFVLLQEYMSKINDNETIRGDQNETNFIKTICKEVDFSRRKTNHKAFDNFKALCNNEYKNLCKPYDAAVQKENVYECAECKYQTPRKADLKKHLKRHMGVCDYCCHYCTRKFFDKYNLERHINANHTKKQQYSCRTCMYTTYMYDSMKRHEKVKHGDHTESPKYICPICFHVSSTKYDMTVHSYIHNQIKAYMCEECGSMFAIKSRLRTHQNTVHNERVHTCQICQKSFQTQSLLKRHTAIHSRFKPYSCPFCNHSSNSQSNLTKHVRNIHSKADFSYHKFIKEK